MKKAAGMEYIQAHLSCSLEVVRPRWFPPRIVNSDTQRRIVWGSWCVTMQKAWDATLIYALFAIRPSSSRFLSEGEGEKVWHIRLNCNSDLLCW